jgi:hypothetical protein
MSARLRDRVAALERGRDAGIDPARICWLIGELEAGRQIGEGREERAAHDLMAALREIDALGECPK